MKIVTENCVKPIQNTKNRGGRGDGGICFQLQHDSTQRVIGPSICKINTDTRYINFHDNDYHDIAGTLNFFQ